MALANTVHGFLRARPGQQVDKYRPETVGLLADLGTPPFDEGTGVGVGDGGLGCGVEDRRRGVVAEDDRDGPVGVTVSDPSTNAIESINARFRRAVNARGHFPTEQSALKVLYLTICSLDPTGKGRARWSNRWKAVLNAFDIAFDGRVSAGRR